MIHYNFIRDSIETGDRLEFASGGLVGPAIRLFTGKKVNHTALCLSINEYSNYAGNRKFILEANAPGIELKPISGRLKDFHGRVWYAKLRATPEQRRAIGDWALQQTDTSYDYGSLFKNAVSRVSADARKFFCSEFRFVALVVGGLLPQYGYDKDKGSVFDIKTGKPVKAPRPGEFGQYDVDEPEMELIF